MVISNVLFMHFTAKDTIGIVDGAREEIEFTVLHWTTYSARQDLTVESQSASHFCHPLLHTANSLPVL